MKVCGNIQHTSNYYYCFLIKVKDQCIKIFLFLCRIFVCKKQGKFLKVVSNCFKKRLYISISETFFICVCVYVRTCVCVCMSACIHTNLLNSSTSPTGLSRQYKYPWQCNLFCKIQRNRLDLSDNDVSFRKPSTPFQL